ncbi:MAG: hypothetical protein P1U67_03165 [Alcanivoracaceae bacterium]|nr:hypothetical protein [Alcanivoracaceae bacterium]
MKMIIRAAMLAVLASTLSGCFLTKLATMPMRVVGSTASVVGAVVSVLPVVGNSADEALEKVDGAIDATADGIDDIPI